ncbi:uncharacterized protein LOC143810257 [Ranitomeya variabilis]|uniref:uncharacterized protein LOC143810257 n=1 Tax=Ranitomeya variabilis TaxID=490064 RepID=UPI0040567399
MDPTCEFLHRKGENTEGSIPAAQDRGAQKMKQHGKRMNGPKVVITVMRATFLQEHLLQRLEEHITRSAQKMTETGARIPKHSIAAPKLSRPPHVTTVTDCETFLEAKKPCISELNPISSPLLKDCDQKVRKHQKRCRKSHQHWENCIFELETLLSRDQGSVEPLKPKLQKASEIIIICERPTFLNEYYLQKLEEHIKEVAERKKTTIIPAMANCTGPWTTSRSPA